MKRLVVGISGASGAMYGIRTLEILKNFEDIETHLIITSSASKTIVHETNFSVDEVKSLADVVYDSSDIGASISSGSFKTHGMIIVPCSMGTMSKVAHGLSLDLVSRAASVTLKESRRLLLMVRETPLSLVYLQNMVTLSQMGTIIMPPVPALYNFPKTISELITHSVCRALGFFEIYPEETKEWKGIVKK